MVTHFYVTLLREIATHLNVIFYVRMHTEKE